MAAASIPSTSGIKQIPSRNKEDENNRPPTIQELLIQVENNLFKSPEHRASILIAVWTCLGGRKSSFGNLEKAFRMLYRESAMMVFGGNWTKMNIIYKRGLARALSLYSHNMGIHVKGSERMCSALVMAVFDPWGDPIIKRLLTDGDVDCDLVKEFVKSEPHELLIVRVECLVKAQFEDAAIKLLRCCLQHLPSNPTEEECGDVENWRLAFKEWLLRLLFRKRRLNDLVAESSSCTCHDGVRLIHQAFRSNFDDSEPLTETLINLFLVRDLLFQSSYCCTAELMRMWCEFQAKKQKSAYEIQETACKLLVGHASCSAQFYLFVDILFEKFGTSLLPLYLEMYIRGLTSDLNYLEVARQEDNKENIIEIENHMAAMYFKLSTLFNSINKEIALECLMGAYSLDPTKERLECIKKLTLQITKEKAIKTQSKDDTKNKSRSGCSRNCPHPPPLKRKAVVMCDQATQVGDDLAGFEAPVEVKDASNQGGCDKAEPVIEMKDGVGKEGDVNNSVGEGQKISKEDPFLDVKVPVSDEGNKSICSVDDSVALKSDTKYQDTSAKMKTRSKVLKSVKDSLNSEENLKSTSFSGHNHTTESSKSAVIDTNVLSGKAASCLDTGKVNHLAQLTECHTVSKKSHSSAIDVNLKENKILVDDETKDIVMLDEKVQQPPGILVNEETVSKNPKDQINNCINGYKEVENVTNEDEKNNLKLNENSIDNALTISDKIVTELNVSILGNNGADTSKSPLNVNANEEVTKQTDNPPAINSDLLLVNLKKLDEANVNLHVIEPRVTRRSEALKNIKTHTFSHVVLDSKILGLPPNTVSDFVTVLECLRNRQLKSSGKWSQIKHMCEDYLENKTALRCSMLNTHLNSSVDSEDDSISDLTPDGFKDFDFHQSNESVVEDPYVNKGHILKRFMNSDSRADMATYVNLSDIHCPQIPLERLFYTDHSSSHGGHKKKHKRHRNHDKSPEKLVLKKFRHGSRAERELIKRKKRKKRKAKKEKGHTKKHCSTHGKVTKAYVKNKKKKHKLKKKKDGNSGFVSGDYCSDFSSEQLMQLVKEHSNSYSKMMPATTSKHPYTSGAADRSVSSSDLSDEPARKKRKVSFSKKRGHSNKHRDKHKHVKSKSSKHKKTIVVETCNTGFKNVVNEDQMGGNIESVKDYSRIVQYSSVKKMEAVQIRQRSVALNLSQVNNKPQNQLPSINSQDKNPQLQEFVHQNFESYSPEDIMKMQMLMSEQQSDVSAISNTASAANNQAILKYFSAKTTSHLLSVAQASNCTLGSDSETSKSPIPSFAGQTSTTQKFTTVHQQPSHLATNVKHLVIGPNTQYKLANTSSATAGTSLIPISIAGNTYTDVQNITATTKNVNSVASPQMTTFTIPVAHNPLGGRLVGNKIVIPLPPCSQGSKTSTTTMALVPTVTTTYATLSGSQPPTNVIIVKSGNNTQIIQHPGSSHPVLANTKLVPIPRNKTVNPVFTKTAPKLIKQAAKKISQPVFKRSLIKTPMLCNATANGPNDAAVNKIIDSSNRLISIAEVHKIDVDKNRIEPTPESLLVQRAIEEAKRAIAESAGEQSSDTKRTSKVKKDNVDSPTTKIQEQKIKTTNKIEEQKAKNDMGEQIITPSNKIEKQVVMDTNKMQKDVISINAKDQLKDSKIEVEQPPLQMSLESKQNSLMDSVKDNPCNQLCIPTVSLSSTTVTDITPTSMENQISNKIPSKTEKENSTGANVVNTMDLNSSISKTAESKTLSAEPVTVLSVQEPNSLPKLKVTENCTIANTERASVPENDKTSTVAPDLELGKVMEGEVSTTVKTSNVIDKQKELSIELSLEKKILLKNSIVELKEVKKNFIDEKKNLKTNSIEKKIELKKNSIEEQIELKKNSFEEQKELKKNSFEEQMELKKNSIEEQQEIQNNLTLLKELPKNFSEHKESQKNNSDRKELQKNYSEKKESLKNSNEKKEFEKGSIEKKESQTDSIEKKEFSKNSTKMEELQKNSIEQKELQENYNKLKESQLNSNEKQDELNTTSIEKLKESTNNCSEGLKDLQQKSEQQNELQPINAENSSPALKICGKTDSGASISEVQTRSFTSISDAVRFSLMDMDDGTDSVENQVLQAFQVSNVSAPNSPSYDNNSTNDDDASVSSSGVILTTPQSTTTTELNASRVSQRFEASVHSSQTEKFSDCQSTVSRTTTWILEDSSVNDTSQALGLQKSAEVDSSEELKDEDRPKKKKKRRDRCDRDLETLHKFWCEICHKGFFSAYNLRRHCRNVHKMVLPKGSSDLPFGPKSSSELSFANNSQCQQQGESSSSEIVTPPRLPYVQQPCVSPKGAEFLLQSPTHENKNQDFSVKVSPTQHTSQMQSSDFQMQTPPRMSSQSSSTHVSPVTQSKDFRLPTSTAASQVQLSPSKISTVSKPATSPKFQRLPTSCATPTVPQLAKVSQQISQISLCGQPTLQQQMQMNQLQPSTLMQPLSTAACQAQQLQAAQCAAHFQANKQIVQQSIGQLQLMHHTGQLPQVQHATHVIQKQTQIQQFKKCSPVQQPSKMTETEQLQQAAQLAQTQQILANQHLQKLMHLRQNAIVASVTTPQLSLGAVQGSPTKSQAQCFQAQLAAARQVAAAAAQLPVQQRNQAAGYSLSSHNTAAHQFFSPGQPNQDQSNCPHSFTNQNVVEFSTNTPSYPTIRLSSETNDGLEDLEQFLLENMPWSGEQAVSHGLAQQAGNRPSSADSLTLAIPTASSQNRSGGQPKSKSSISKPKARKPVATSCSKNLLGNLGRGVKKKSSKKISKSADNDCTGTKSDVFSQTSLINQQSHGMDLMSMQCSKGTSSNLLSSKSLSKNAMNSVNETDSSDSVQCINVTLNPHQKICSGLNFSTFSTADKNINSFCSADQNSARLYEEHNKNSFLDQRNLVNKNCSNLANNTNANLCDNDPLHAGSPFAFAAKESLPNSRTTFCQNNDPSMCPNRSETSQAVFLGQRNIESCDMRTNLQQNSAFEGQHSSVSCLQASPSVQVGNVSTSDCARTSVSDIHNLFLDGKTASNNESAVSVKINNISFNLLSDSNEVTTESVNTAAVNKIPANNEASGDTFLQNTKVSISEKGVFKENVSSVSILNSDHVELSKTNLYEISKNINKIMESDIQDMNTLYTDASNSKDINFNDVPSKSIILDNSNPVLETNAISKNDNADIEKSVLINEPALIGSKYILKHNNLVNACENLETIENSGALSDSEVGGHNVINRQFANSLQDDKIIKAAEPNGLNNCDNESLSINFKNQEKHSSQENKVPNDVNHVSEFLYSVENDKSDTVKQITLKIRKSQEFSNNKYDTFEKPQNNLKESKKDSHKKKTNLAKKKCDAIENCNGNKASPKLDINSNIQSIKVSSNDTSCGQNETQCKVVPLPETGVETPNEVHKNVTGAESKLPTPPEQISPGRLRLRDTPKTSVKRVCPCCVNNGTPKKCRSSANKNVIKLFGPTGQSNKSKATLKARKGPNAKSAKANTRSSQRLRSRKNDAVS